ncbi:hypothetical protein [Aliikangiella sp. IMCC44359]|uniref:hypothetical protein n=1 Tax=Aliikangiella sp. IMCC44359 TaxID=3459125 RepID=UPI00403B09E4
MIKNIILILSLLISQPVLADNTQSIFFEHLTQLCGQSYNGKTVFPDTTQSQFFGKKLTIHISHCEKNTLKIPLQVGNDKSRTWVIAKTSKGLLLKHDHRHPDGTPDKITMYGGYSNNQGTELAQSFIADKETYQMMPEAKTNVWTLSFNQTKTELTYYLERHSKARFKAIFNLTPKKSK